MNWLDRAIQDWRIRRALPWIADGARVLDVGCYDDTLFRRLGPRLRHGVGIDPALTTAYDSARFRMTPGAFPDVPVPEAPFDVVTMLAVVEHVPAEEIGAWVHACREVLAAGGRVIVTMPAPMVDPILHTLIRLRLLHGMEAEQHHGLEPARVVDAFARGGFSLRRSQRFQLRLNNLFVFDAPTAA